jgi:hypothetical protein
VQNFLKRHDAFGALLVRTEQPVVVGRVVVAAQPEQVLRMVVLALVNGLRDL